MLKLIYTFRFVNHNFNYIFKFSRVPKFVTGRFQRKHTVDCVHVRVKAWEIFNNISRAFYFLLLIMKKEKFQNTLKDLAKTIHDNFRKYLKFQLLILTIKKY